MALNEYQFKKFGTSLPGATKPRTMASWKDRANVLAAARAGSIKSTKKSPSKLSKKIGGYIAGVDSKKGK